MNMPIKDSIRKQLHGLANTIELVETYSTIRPYAVIVNGTVVLKTNQYKKADLVFEGIIIGMRTHISVS